MTRPPRRIRSLTKPSSFLSFDSVHAAAAARKGLLTRESTLNPVMLHSILHDGRETGMNIFAGFVILILLLTLLACGSQQSSSPTPYPPQPTLTPFPPHSTPTPYPVQSTPTPYPLHPTPTAYPAQSTPTPYPPEPTPKVGVGQRQVGNEIIAVLHSVEVISGTAVRVDFTLENTGTDAFDYNPLYSELRLDDGKRVSYDRDAYDDEMHRRPILPTVRPGEILRVREGYIIPQGSKPIGFSWEQRGRWISFVVDNYTAR